VAATGPSRGQAGAGPFADQVAFELGQGGEHVEDELAAGVVGSIASWRLRNPIPRSAGPVLVSTMWRRSGRGGRAFRRPGCRRAAAGPGAGRGWGGRRGRRWRLGEDAVAAGALESVDLERGSATGRRGSYACRSASASRDAYEPCPLAYGASGPLGGACVPLAFRTG
jgi:hypothetical protein